MPKKRIDHKGKPKHSAEQTDDYPFKKPSSENTEEEYTTVVDCEANKKYSKRIIENNWSKYEASFTEFESEKDETFPKTDDFNYLIKTASSDCSHFEFNSEKLWKSEHNSTPSSEIFKLDLNILSQGLACVPFYELMGLTEKELTAEDKKRFDEAARNSWKEYISVGKKDKTNVKNLDPEIVEVKGDLGGGENEDKESIERVQEEIENESGGDKLECKKMFFSEKEENLEDWLDSVLDD